MKMRRKRRDRQYVGLLYVLPWIIGFAVFSAYPLLSSLYYSFTTYNIISKPVFVGMQNYVTAFTKDATFWPSVVATIKYVGVSLPLRLIVSFLIALVVVRNFKGIGLFRTIYFIPSLLGGSIAICIAWEALFNANGAVNSLLTLLGVDPVMWLTDKRFAIYTLALLNIWQFGGSMIIFLAALKQVPADMYEVARIEGAPRLWTLFRVTLPMISPVVLFNILMEMIKTFQDFTSAFVITKGGPLYSTYLYAYKLYEEAFMNYKMGYASALSWIFFVALMLLTLLIFRLSNKYVYYQD